MKNKPSFRETPTTKRQKRDARREEETPAEAAARVERGRKNAEVTEFLIPRLFGWRNPEFVTEGFGKHRVCASGRVHSVKGWYAENPQTGQEELFRHNIANEIEASRLVVDLMNRRGYIFEAAREPGGDWYAAFYHADDGKRSAHYSDESEPFAVCAAARAVIEKQTDWK